MQTLPVARQRAFWMLVMVLAFVVALVSGGLLIQRWAQPEQAAAGSASASLTAEAQVSGEGSSFSEVFTLSGGDYQVALALEPECSYTLLLVPEDFEQAGQSLGDMVGESSVQRSLSIPAGQYTVNSTSSPHCTWQASFARL